MTPARHLCSFLIAILSFINTNAQRNPAPIDHLGVKGPIAFNRKSYNLTWSSHPSTTYYKQEYLPKGEDVNKFKSMILLEVATGAIVLKDVVEAKVAELKGMGATNPFISYESSFNAEKQEYILDFVITQNSPDNKSAIIAERNVYRYKNLAAKNGILLFAISTRSYGADTKAFLATPKADKKAMVDKVREFVLPVVTVK